MIRKFFVFFICLLFVLSITGCPDVTKEKDDDEKASGFTLSGDIIVRFLEINPTHTVTIKLLPDNNIGSTALYSTTTSSWRDTKAIETFIRYATYTISGITAGNYYIYTTINPVSNMSGYVPDGPTYIEITSDVSGHDINFTD